MKTNLRVVPLLVIAILLGACTPQGKGILGSNESVEDIVDQATKAAPFGYDVVVDTISYNSCVSNNNNNDHIHGFKMGVSEGFVSSTSTAVKAGVKLRSDFLQYAGKNFQPQYPSETVTPVQVQNILRDSDLNKDAFIQFAIRQTSDLQAIPDLISPGSNGTKTVALPGRDVVVIQKFLHQGYLGYSLTKDVRYSTTGTVLAEGPRVYNLSDGAEPKTIEAQFMFSNIIDGSVQLPAADPTNPENLVAAELYAESIRKRFTSNSSAKLILAATFGGAAEVPDNLADTTTNHINKLKRQAKSDGTFDVTKAFGRGYQLKFESKAPGKAGWVANILTGVTEIDLATGSPAAGASWTGACENFVIVRSDHWNNKKANEPTCTPLTASDLSTARQLQLKKINRHYSDDQWNVGLFLPKDTDPTPGVRAGLELCLSPKNGSCYLPTAGIVFSEPGTDVGIQYDKTKECYLTAYSAMGQNYTTSPTLDEKRKLGRCAQYASICTRTSPNF